MIISLNTQTGAVASDRPLTREDKVMLHSMIDYVFELDNPPHKLSLDERLDLLNAMKHEQNQSKEI